VKEIGYIADAVELRAWAKGGVFALDAFKDELWAALGEGEDAEEVAQLVVSEIQQRQQILGDSYPFYSDGYTVEVTVQQPNRTTYLFCLGLSLLPPAYIENEQRSLQFETVAMRAAQGFYGGVALRIGAPWRTEEIPTFETLLNRVVQLIPNLGSLLETAAPGGGDAGWDALIVKSFRDNSFPRFIVLGNCATGRSDWLTKGMETQPNFLWRTYFAHEHESVLTTFLAVPFIMDEDARRKKLSDTAMTFDRFRICEHAPESSEEVAQWLESSRPAALDVPFN